MYLQQLGTRAKKAVALPLPLNYTIAFSIAKSINVHKSFMHNIILCACYRHRVRKLLQTFQFWWENTQANVNLHKLMLIYLLNFNSQLLPIKYSNFVYNLLKCIDSVFYVSVSCVGVFFSNLFRFNEMGCFK